MVTGQRIQRCAEDFTALRDKLLYDDAVAIP